MRGVAGGKARADVHHQRLFLIHHLLLKISPALVNDACADQVFGQHRRGTDGAVGSGQTQRERPQQIGRRNRLALA